MTSRNRQPGRLVRAPENYVPASLAEEICAGGMNDERRAFLRRSLLGAAGASAALALGHSARAGQPPGDPAILEKQPWQTSLGHPVAAIGYGVPSRYEANLQRRESPGLTRVSAASVAFTPLQGLFGMITPSGLHFERHHQGWVDIDPNKHRLMINGLVAQPRVYTMNDLMRLPSVSRIHFIECGANTGLEWGNVAVPSVQYTHGMLSCSEFTGVPLALLLDDCGVDLKAGKYVLAEGGEGSGMTRTIPMENALDDALVVWGMNGEMLRPENGYPLRLVVPGVQGVSSVKWLDKGFYNVSGMAWSGRGKVASVDVSFDGGRNWRKARLESPVLSKAVTRFNIDWDWDGAPAILQSRAVDETGYVQPSIRVLREVRGTRSIYHNNAIQSWKIEANGEVSNVQAG